MVKRKLVRAFTLVELLVVISIMGILAALVFTSYSRYIGKANDLKCAANLRSILIGALNFANDRNGLLWSRKDVGYSKFRMVDDPLGLPILMKDYIDKKAWNCPSSRPALGKFGNDFTWSVASTLDTNSVVTMKASSTLLIWDAYAYSLPSMYNASEDIKGDGTSTGPSALQVKFYYWPHVDHTAANWGYLDGHVVTGESAAR